MNCEMLVPGAEQPDGSLVVVYDCARKEYLVESARLWGI
jgi:hypothetical protein